MKLASFDIFDTVLIRKCGNPENVYVLMAKELYPKDIARQDEFVKWRVYRNSGLLGKNYKLNDVYETSDIDSFPEYTREQLIKLEQEVEGKQLIRNRCAISVLVDYRKSGYRIAFISDMYLSRDFIKTILLREGIFNREDYLYVSNEVECRKDDGTLFDYVREMLHPDKWIHFGDNKYSDYKIPKKKGIKVHRLALPYTNIETKIEGLSRMLPNTYELSILAGLERTVRSIFSDTPVSRIAVDFQAAAYIPYVRYILDDSYRRGITRLYFLSRDGYILEKIAEQLPHEKIELKYLFVSRASLVLPFLYKANEKQFESILINDWVNIDKVLSRLKLSRQQLREHGVVFDFVEIITEKQRHEFVDAMFKSDIYVIWQKEAEIQYNLCVGYFEQEGLLDHQKCALVDVGWLGTTRLMINAIRATAKPDIEQCYSYYWTVRSDVIPGKFGHYNIYIHDCKMNYAITPLFEDYFSLCPYPTTKGYRLVRTHFEPILKNENSTVVGERIKYNETVLITLSHLICQYYISDLSLYFWSKYSIDNFQMFERKDIDYSPFENFYSENLPMVKKLSIIDMLKVVFGIRISAMEEASLFLSYGYHFGYGLSWIQKRVCKAKIKFKEKFKSSFP